jgi:ketol-acid reductoisomerase
MNHHASADLVLDVEREVASNALHDLADEAMENLRILCQDGSLPSEILSSLEATSTTGQDPSLAANLAQQELETIVAQISEVSVAGDQERLSRIQALGLAALATMLSSRRQKLNASKVSLEQCRAQMKQSNRSVALAGSRCAPNRRLQSCRCFGQHWWPWTLF